MTAPLSDTSRADPPDVDGIRAGWRIALDAAQSALLAAAPVLPASEEHDRVRQLADERTRTAPLLDSLARDQRSMAPFSHLGLPPRRLEALPR
jgi:hypothetical protein